MPNEPQKKDLVEEARKLLAEMPRRRLMPLSDCEIHLLRQLCDEVEREDKDHRLTIDTFRQQERIWQQKFDEQDQANTALREQLAQEHQNRELSASMNQSRISELQSRLAQVEKEREFWNRLKAATGKLSSSAAAELADILENL